MLSATLAAATALAIWWLTTALIMRLARLERHTFVWTLAGASLLLAAALYGIVRSRADTSAGGIYLGFVCSVAVWGWLETSFLLGYATGPRQRACLPGCAGWRHFLHAVQAILWHELSIIALAAVTFLLDWPGRNHVALWTLLILWGMRESAKLNLFLGVRNPGDELLPAHLRYLRAYFRRQSMNWLFPLSVTAASVLLVFLVQRALAPGASDAAVTTASLLATFTFLGLIEHWVLVLPIPVAALWAASVRSREVHG